MVGSNDHWSRAGASRFVTLNWIIGLLIAMEVLPVIFGVVRSAWLRAQETARISQALDQLAAIDHMLWLYSEEHNGRYPEADASGRPFANSNEAFRALLAASKEKDEMLFEGPLGPARADGRIGDPPAFSQAVEPGECHWAMARGVEPGNEGDPLVWENSQSGGWNPVWDPTLDRDEPGSTWSAGRVLILTNDHGIRTYKVAEKARPSRLEKLRNPGPNLFERVQPREVLDPVGLQRK